jgi:hypothetical protein
VAGPTRGTDYALHAGRNAIGRDPSHGIVVGGPGISATEPHAIIHFDPAGDEATYSVQPAETGKVHLNGEPISSTHSLYSYDLLAVGDTRLLFVPLCGDRFQWNLAYQADPGGHG